MHNNFYFLRQLSSSLQSVLDGTVISECFSQSKDELILRFETRTSPFFIKVNVSPRLSCLSCPEKFERARKNSVDLFPSLIGQRVHGIRQFKNERSFAILLSNEMVILFKMHGNRSNVIVFTGNESELFQTSIEADQTLSLDTLDREIDFSFENFERHHRELQKVYFTFGKWVWEYLESKGFSSLPIQSKWDILQQTISMLDSPTFYISNINNRIHLLLFSFGNTIKKTDGALRAANEFYYHFTALDAFLSLKNQMLASINHRINANQNYIGKNEEKLRELGEGHDYKIWADLIMANMHSIKPNSSNVSLADFYDNNRSVEVKLKPNLNAQKNAEVYYRKAKNQQIEIGKLSEGIESKREENARLNDQLRRIEETKDLKTLREISPSTISKKTQITSLPYREYEFKGYRIWVGRDAGANDELTLKYAFKEDLWLHAKDVSGSHVVVKHQAGKNFPKDVIEYAAQLAAFHSKRKTETLCPVIYTPKKFVRKRKGDPAGLVVVDRENVIMVEPKISS